MIQFGEVVCNKVQAMFENEDKDLLMSQQSEIQVEKPESYLQMEEPEMTKIPLLENQFEVSYNPFEASVTQQNGFGRTESGKSDLGAVEVKIKCGVCSRAVDEDNYWAHILARHPMTAALSTSKMIVVSKEEAHNFSEISRLAKLTH